MATEDRETRESRKRARSAAVKATVILHRIQTRHNTLRQYKNSNSMR